MKKWYKLLLDYDSKKAGELVELEEGDVAALVKAKIIEEKSVDPDVKAFDDKVTEFKDSITKTVNTAITAAIKKVSDGVQLQVVSEPIQRSVRAVFGDWGVFAKDVKQFSAGGAMTKNLETYTKFREEEMATIKAVSGHSELVAEDGGLLVPVEMSAEIFKKAFPEGDLTSRLDNRQINGNAIEYNAIVEDSRATGSRHGGVTGYWMGEADQFTSSKAKWKKIAFKLEKLGVFCFVTDELLEDGSLSLEQELNQLAAAEIRFLVNDALINGTGLKQPKGILNSSALISITRTTTLRVKLVDIENMWARAAAWCRPNMVWLANQEVEPELNKMFMPVTNVVGDQNVGGWPVYLPPGGISGAAYGSLKGRPVILTEWSAALGTIGDLILVDMSQYRMVTKRNGIQSAMSMHLRFDYGENAYRFSFRVDGQSMWAKAVTPYKSTANATLSHALALTTV